VFTIYPLEFRKSSPPAGPSPCRHSSAPFGVGCLLKRKEKEEMKKKKTKNISNSLPAEVFRSYPPMQNQKNLHNFA
jgi:hypothetical protein